MIAAVKTTQEANSENSGGNVGVVGKGVRPHDLESSPNTCTGNTDTWWRSGDTKKRTYDLRGVNIGERVLGREESKGRRQLWVWSGDQCY